MTHEPATAAGQGIVIEIGGIPIQVRSESPEFLRMLEERYSGFLNCEAHPVFEFDVELVQPRRISAEDDVVVSFDSGRWLIERGDFRAEWEPETRRGKIVQSANPYSIDSVLRIVHTLVLAREGGLLVHAASAVRNGKAFLFAGVSEAGKTTISRLAPGDVTLLTDEISYLRCDGGRNGGRDGNGYAAYGTPFAGELARAGENVKAPLAALYLLRKGTENTIEPVRASDAARMLLENVLFFACDPNLVGMVFDAACELVQHVPVYRLTFFPDARVWELIG